MWRNYLTVGIRALARSRTYAFINIFGLALGLAACLLILLYVRYEYSYDNWMPDAERVFQVQTTIRDPNAADVSRLQAAAAPVAAALGKDFPQIEAVSQLSFSGLTYRDRGEAKQVGMLVADQPFFTIIGTDFLHGDARTALRDANSLVLSRSQAEKMFGTADVLGRTVTEIRGSGDRDLRVTGVFENLPKNSHVELSVIGKAEPSDCWGCIGGYVYAKLRPGADAEAINKALPAWERRNIPRTGPGGESAGDTADWRLVNVRDVHLGEAQEASLRVGNDARSIATFGVVALLILGMACVNFTNLATARASQRAREVALRKVLGASRRQLIAQFLSESVLLTLLAMLVALAAVELALPSLSAFLDADLRMAYFGPDGMMLPVLALVVLVGAVGGLYPAFYLSRFQPAQVLKANKSAAEAAGSGQLRSALVVAQFAVSIGLIICTAIVYFQTSFAMSADPGFRRENLLQVTNVGRQQVRPVLETLKTEIARLDGVKAVAATQIPVANEQIRRASVIVPSRAGLLELGSYSVEPEFFETMGMRLVAGRLLSDRFAKDDASLPAGGNGDPSPESLKALAARGANIVVNELGARRLGFVRASDAVGKQIRVAVAPGEDGILPATIVGVVADARFRSVRDPVEASIYYNGGLDSDLMVRFSGTDPVALRERIGRLWKRLVVDVPFEAELAEEEVAELYGAERARAQTFAGFSILAIIIASLGLFGLAAFTAERRTKEIGIRKVLGARSRDIVRLLAWQFSKPVIVANLIAWPAAWWAMRDWLNEFDARIDLGPGPFVLAGALALAIALGTIAAHALKVARSNPINALRYE